MKARTLTMAGVLVAIWGCDRARVSEDQPATEFRADVEAKLTEFESRIARLEEQKHVLAEPEVETVEARKDAAEEKIETLRDSGLPKLTEASGEELNTMKSNVNDTLEEIDQTIREAERVVTRPPLEPSTPDLPATIPS